MDEEIPFYDGDYGDFDMYDEEDENFYVDQDYEFDEHRVSFIELFNGCVTPIILESLSPVIKLILCNFALKIFTSFVPLSSTFIHLSSIIAGLWAVWIFSQWKMIYMLFLCGLAYLTLFLVNKTGRKCHGRFCVIFVVLFIIICETYLVDTKNWHEIRGMQMILTMKVISLGYDLDSGQISRFPTIFEFGGYALSPGSVIFGPWHNFRDYIKIVHTKIFPSIFWFLRIFISAVFSLAFLLFSSCFTNWLISDSSNRWKIAYRDALSFRTSHYFVSFISETTILIAGRTGSDFWEFFVTQPAKIEIPRSLSEVVVYWNKPMHMWLKTYVFRIVKPLGNYKAILSTYVASSLLHGLNFQLAAVLLSLGFYTFIEYEFREKLGKIFNACIFARKCKHDCDHQFKTYHPLVITTNCIFTILSMFHLAYLGVMFDNSQIQDQGYNMEHTLHKWNQLNFASHWVIFGMYLIHLLI